MSEVNIQASWVSGLQFVATGEGSNASFVLDGAPEHGGKGAGIRPMEALLCSLAGCTGMDVISILKKKRQKITDFQINITGDRAEEHPMRYTSIHIEFVARGNNVSLEALQRAAELSQTKYCGTAASIGAPIDFTCRVEQDENISEADAKA